MIDLTDLTDEDLNDSLHVVDKAYERLINQTPKLSYAKVLANASTCTNEIFVRKKDNFINFKRSINISTQTKIKCKTVSTQTYASSDFLKENRLSTIKKIAKDLSINILIYLFVYCVFMK